MMKELGMKGQILGSAVVTCGTLPVQDSPKASISSLREAPLVAQSQRRAPLHHTPYLVPVYVVGL